MIVINLVPEHLRKRSARGASSLIGLDIPREVLLGVGGAFIAFLVVAHVLLLAAQSVQGMSLGLAKASWGRLLPDRNRIDVLGTELRGLRKKVTTITGIASAGTSPWSRKMNALGDALPKGVWLKKINLDSGTLTLEGSAFSKTQSEIVTIGNFVAGLKKEGAFADDFSSIEVRSIQRGKRGPTEVVDFVITAKLK
ncbi:MAG: PilN domain-containing protein [Candidatus Omnitrophica bacterium]|nr:PilN domain-containing protein [Candidatus Omnitrophota bacterium]